MLGTSGIIITAAVLLFNINTSDGITQSKESSSEMSSKIELAEETPSKKALEISAAIEGGTILEKENLENTSNEKLEEVQPTEILTNPFTEISNSLTPSHSSMNYYYKQEIVKEEMVFLISDKTSTDELNAIKSAAEKAGMTFEYKMNTRRNSLKKLKMVITHEDTNSRTSLLFSRDFELEIGWIQDGTGKAVEFHSSDAERIYEAISDTADELDSIFDQHENELQMLYKENDLLLDQSLAHLDVEKERLINQLDDIGTEELDAALLELDHILIGSKEVETALLVEGSEKEDAAAESEYKRVTYIITDHTSEEELAAIQAEAVKAGINVSQTSKFKKEKLRELHLNMNLINAEGEKLKSSFSVFSGKNGSYSMTVVWRINEEGKAVDFDGNTCQSICN